MSCGRGAVEPLPRPMRPHGWVHGQQVSVQNGEQMGQRPLLAVPYAIQLLPDAGSAWRQRRDYTGDAARAVLCECVHHSRCLGMHLERLPKHAQPLDRTHSGKPRKRVGRNTHVVLQLLPPGKEFRKRFQGGSDLLRRALDNRDLLSTTGT